MDISYDDEDDDFYEFDDILEEGEDAEAAKEARKAAKKAAKKERMKGIREQIKNLNEQLNSGDPNQSPQVGEELADFYARTSVYWTQKALESIGTSTASNEELSVKELKREGFNLAQSRFEELKHVLDRLGELEADQNESNDKKERKEKKKSKKDKKDKKDKKKDSRR